MTRNKVGQRKPSAIDLESAGLLPFAATPHLEQLYRSTISLIDYQLQTLNNGVSYSYLDELMCNDQVLIYANASIKMLNNLYEASLIGWQNFPASHFLLRQYRNNSHHKEVGNFRPFQTHHGHEFYVWPELQKLPDIKAKYPNWAKKGSILTLQSLITDNQAYIRILVAEAEGVLKSSNQSLKFRKVYPMAAMGGMVKEDDFSNWELN